MSESKILLPGPARPVVRWDGLAGSAAAMHLAQAAARLPAPLLVVARDAAALARLEDELRFYADPSLPVLVFPDYETLPYDQFSPHPDIISQRLRALSQLPTLRAGLVVTDLPTSLQRLAPRSFVDGHAFTLATGAELDLDGLRLRLAAAGYASVPQVGAPGEFAIRARLSASIVWNCCRRGSSASTRTRSATSGAASAPASRAISPA
jgi:transcription-repair coupling factor (superfamily II helicase)